jgi:hypothetical protein
MVLTLQLDVASCVPERVRDPVPDAGGACVWLVTGEPGGLDSLQQRLRRQGWLVKRSRALLKLPPCCR